MTEPLSDAELTDWRDDLEGPPPWDFAADADDRDWQLSVLATIAALRSRITELEGERDYWHLTHDEAVEVWSCRAATAEARNATLERVATWAAETVETLTGTPAESSLSFAGLRHALASLTTATTEPGFVTVHAPNGIDYTVARQSATTERSDDEPMKANADQHGATCADTPLDHSCGDTDAEIDQGVTWRQMVTIQSETMRAVAALHVKVEGPGGTSDGTCAECWHLYPCRTRHLCNGWGDGDECFESGWCEHAKVRVGG